MVIHFVFIHYQEMSAGSSPVFQSIDFKNLVIVYSLAIFIIEINVPMFIYLVFFKTTVELKPPLSSVKYCDLQYVYGIIFYITLLQAKIIN